MLNAASRLRLPRDLLSGWKGLKRVWLTALVVGVAGAGLLQALGPPVSIPRDISKLPTSAAPPVAALQAPAKSGSITAAPPAQSSNRHLAETPGRAVPGPVTDPDPALLEPFRPAARAGDPASVAGRADQPNAGLPRISADGRAPMHEYAAGFDPTTRRPRVGIIVAGIGMNEADSLAAAHDLPGGVTFAVSPYAINPDRLLASVRMSEHEYLLSIPMEPQGYPGNDPDDRHALMTSLPPAENLARLQWCLSRIAGYVGVTSALGPMRGERFAGMEDQLDAMLHDVAARGLLFVDARPGQPVASVAWNRSVDLLIDQDPLDDATLDARLQALNKIAKDKGSALGLVSAPRPVALARLAAWSNTLAANGLVLAPVSALVKPPATRDQTQ